ncbi:MAG: MerR family transcriptional regulator [Oscillospiraceae bacterium]
MNKNFIPSGAFAKLCDTSKETLRHYKDLGILIPKYKGENGYQYYDAEQFYDYYAISIFKKTGTSLSKIKECIRHQNIPIILDTLKEQEHALAEEKRKIEEMQFIIRNSIVNMTLGLSHPTLNIQPQIGNFPKEHLIAVPHNEFDIAQHQADEDAMLISILAKYKAVCDQHCVQTDYQLGAIIGLQDKGITHLYTRVDKAYKNKYYQQKPAGKYLYIIQRGNWDLTTCYDTLFSYISQNRIKVTGNIYSYDLAGFMINGVEENSMTIISIQVQEEQGD